MSSLVVKGALPERVQEIREEYYESPKFKKTEIPFEESYCLANIGRQPEDYDGPQRYCQNRVAKDGNHPRCRFHGAFGEPQPQNMDKHATLKHSMYALPETIRETMNGEEKELLDWVMTWPEVYGIDLLSDPASAHTFDTLAIEMVRQARSSDYILSNTEVTTEGVYDAAGNQLETKEVPNSLITEHQSQLRMIEKLKDSLGITRKQSNAASQTEDRTEVLDGLTSALGDLINESGAEYDPLTFEE